MLLLWVSLLNRGLGIGTTARGTSKVTALLQTKIRTIPGCESRAVVLASEIPQGQPARQTLNGNSSIVE
jgi:hypothetical protein